MRGFSGKRILAVLIVALAIALWVLMSAPLAQTSKAEKPVVQKAAPLKLEKPKDQKAIPLNKPAIPPATEVEIQRRFNELKRELLDDRADSIEWWLAVVAIVLTFFGIVVAIGGFFGIRIFREIVADARESAKEAKQIVADAQKSAEVADQVATDARKSAEDAKELVEEIKEYRDETKAIRDETAETAESDPEEVRQYVEGIRKNPQSSPEEKNLSKKIEEALSLEGQGEKDKALEAWRGIANAARGIDSDLTARAWFSVGHLLQPNGKHEEVIAMYDEAIRLNPNLAEAYNNRGNAKSSLGRHEAAIADYDDAIRLDPNRAESYYNRGITRSELGQYEAAIDEYTKAIRLDPNYAGAYTNRGNAKGSLRRHEDAVVDYSNAIRLKPDYALAYHNRGVAHVALGDTNAARRDFERACDLARASDNQALAALSEQRLRVLDEQ